MSTRFENLLSVNMLGYFHYGQRLRYIASEKTPEVMKMFSMEDLSEIVDIIVARESCTFPGDTSLIIRFYDSATVTFSWENSDLGSQEATFDVVQFVKIIDISKVRSLVLSRQQE